MVTFFPSSFLRKILSHKGEFIIRNFQHHRQWRYGIKKLKTKLKSWFVAEMLCKFVIKIIKIFFVTDRI